jgi:S1-C subfamily serine protease
LIADAPRTIDVNYHARREVLRDAYEAGPPANVLVEVDDRRGAGVLIGDEGYVLTAGHLLIGDVKDATVTLGDGTKVKGQTAGICRDLDCGLVRLESPPEIRGVELADQKEFDFRGERLCLVTGYYQSDKGPLRPRASHVRMDGELDSVLLTRGTMPGPWCRGLYDSSGRLLGIFMRPTLHYGRPHLHVGQLSSNAAWIAEQLPRLKRGEVWGSWYPGTGPMIGVYVTSVGEGARVTDVTPGAPAAAVGIQVEDLIVEVNGKPVRSLYDMYHALADVDPGREVTINARRDKQQLTHKVRVVHRFDY